MSRDQNLLFGVFAVQLGKISPQQLAAAAAAWATDPTSSLGERLVAEGAMGQADCELIAGFVDQAVQAHGGDPEQTLAAFGGRAKVMQSFAGTIAPTDSGGVETRTPTEDVTQLLGEDSIPGVVESPGRYTLRSEYARGGMGRVLLVHDEHLGREVALKELLPEIARHGSDSDTGTPVRKSMPMIARFLQEAKITGQLEHPSIVPVYELGTRADGSIYYTMKLVRGKTLSQAISEADGLQGRLGLLSHFVDLCNAIAYAHSRGVIHRDLKPGNVMVGEFGETVVLDWGLAKTKGQPDQHADGYAETLRAMNMGDEVEFAKTQYGQALGTPMYMPPEQATGDLDNIDERSDVYSLGAILYEILTGHPPHTGDSLASVLKHVIQDEPRPIQDFAANAPEEVAAITTKALAKDPTARFQSAKELASDIQNFLAGRIVSAHEYALRDYVSRFYNRNKAMVWAGAVFVMILVVTLGGYARYARIAQASTETKLLTFYESLVDQSVTIDRRLRDLDYSSEWGEEEQKQRIHIRDVKSVQAPYLPSYIEVVPDLLIDRFERFGQYEIVGQGEDFDYEVELRGLHSDSTYYVDLSVYRGNLLLAQSPVSRITVPELSDSEASGRIRSLVSENLASAITFSLLTDIALGIPDAPVLITEDPIAMSCSLTRNDSGSSRSATGIAIRIQSNSGLQELKLNDRAIIEQPWPSMSGHSSYRFQEDLDVVGEIVITARELGGDEVIYKLALDDFASTRLSDSDILADPEMSMPIAVSDFVHETGPGKYERQHALLSNLEIGLQDRFQLVERGQIGTVLEEQRTSQSITFRDSDTRIQLGQIVASQYYLSGMLTTYFDDIGLRQEGYVASVTLRSATNSDATAFYSRLDTVDNPAQIKRAVDDLVSQIFSYFPRTFGKLKYARGDKIIVELDDPANIRVGTLIILLKVIAPAFIDDDTGEVLVPATYAPAGRARIQRIGENGQFMAQIIQKDDDILPFSGQLVVTW